MSKDEIITAVAITNDRQILAKLSDILNRRDENTTGKSSPDTRLITYRETAKRLGVSYTTVWRLIKDGEIEVVSVRGKNRVKLSSVMKFVGL